MILHHSFLLFPGRCRLLPSFFTNSTNPWVPSFQRNVVLHKGSGLSLEIQSQPNSGGQLLWSFRAIGFSGWFHRFARLTWQEMDMNCMGNGYEMNGWMRKNTKPQRKKNIISWKSDIFWVKSSQGTEWKGAEARSLVVWLHRSLNPPGRMWSKPPRVWITF